MGRGKQRKFEVPNAVTPGQLDALLEKHAHRGLRLVKRQHYNYATGAYAIREVWVDARGYERDPVTYHTSVVDPGSPVQQRRRTPSSPTSSRERKALKATQRTANSTGKRTAQARPRDRRKKTVR